MINAHIQNTTAFVYAGPRFYLFPISVEFGGEDGGLDRKEAPRFEPSALFHRMGIESTFLGLGVDRIDYTKGIPERFRGIERLLDQYPSYCGRLTFVQIGAPGRAHIKRYQDLITEVEEEAERINRQFRVGTWQPILLLKRHHTHAEIQQYYRAADFCLVTSLHDGMNLVAKEYVASRLDEQGALILSRFTGASYELADGALTVNPYDAGELAGSIHTALTMPADERSARMRRMRAVIKEHNVYRWAGNLITELAAIRLVMLPYPSNKTDVRREAPAGHKDRIEPLLAEDRASRLPQGCTAPTLEPGRSSWTSLASLATHSGHPAARTPTDT